MKYFTTIFLLLMMVGIARAEGPFQELNFDAALAAAKKDGKIIMIDFYTTWCGPCKKLDQTTWQDNQVRGWLTEKTIALKIDAEKEESLAARYKISAYPTILFIKTDGNEMDRIVGYRDAKQFLLEANDTLAGRDSVTRAKEKLTSENENDPNLRMEYARALMNKGNYKEALDELIWCFDNGEKQRPGFGGVRLSFLLGDIARLGRRYPPAIAALKERRDQFQTALLAGDNVRESGIGLARINEELNEAARNLEIFDQLQAQGEKGKAGREILFNQVFEQLLEARRYQDINNNLGDFKTRVDQEYQRFARLEKDSYLTANPDKREQIEGIIRKSVVKGIGRIYEMLIGLKRASEAEEIAEGLIKFSNSGLTFAELIRRADRAQAENLTKTLRERADKDLPAAERDKMMAALLNPGR